MKRIILSIGVFVLVFGLLIQGFNVLNNKQNEEDYQRIEENIKNAIIYCYSIEGKYPEDIDYLKKNYGLFFNSDLYQIHYRFVGSNIMPEYDVFRKGKQ